MHLEPRPKKNGTVLILGAGASCAALVKDAPPVIRDFVKEGRTRKLVSDYSRLWHFLHRTGVRLSDLDMALTFEVSLN